MAPLSTAAPPTVQRVGVGIDTSRYGHYAAFLRDDLQPAAAELMFAESAAGYAQLRQRLEHIAQRLGRVAARGGEPGRGPQAGCTGEDRGHRGRFDHKHAQCTTNADDRRAYRR